MSKWALRGAGVVAGAIAGAIVAAFVIVAGAGVFWLFVFGDDAWPRWAEIALVTAGYGAGLVVFASVAVVMWRRA